MSSLCGSNNKNGEKLLKAITENPDLPVIFLFPQYRPTSWDSVEFTNDMTVEKGEILDEEDVRYRFRDKVYTSRLDFELDVKDILSYGYPEHMSNEEKEEYENAVEYELSEWEDCWRECLIVRLDEEEYR